MLNADDAHMSRSCARASELWRRLLMSGTLVLLIALLLWLAPLAATSRAASTKRLCLAAGPVGCVRALTIARAADSEEEAEGEDESEEAEEEAASAEAEAEEEAESEGPASHQRHKPASPSSHRSGSSASAPVISRLALTAKATAALRHSKPLASAVEFSFILSAPAKVHVTLVEQTNSHGHKRWTTLPDSLTTNAGKGRGSGKLKGHNRLTAGRYRLTVKPSNGRSRSIYLSTGS